MKAKRQRKIIDLINEYNIETQEELASKLVESGFSVTQATVSRDIRELNLIKTSNEKGGQKYTVKSSPDIVDDSKYMRVLNDGVLSMQCAENMLVIKTVSGMAMAVGAAIDAINIEQIIGCIAGDDTIMCAAKTADMALGAAEKLRSFVRLNK